MPSLETLPPSPVPLSEHARSLKLVKSQPPRPLWGYLLVAMATSIGGIVMGLIYLAKDGSTNKRFGAAALLAGFVLPLLIVSYLIIDQARQAGSRAPTPAQPGVQILE